MGPQRLSHGPSRGFRVSSLFLSSVLSGGCHSITEPGQSPQCGGEPAGEGLRARKAKEHHPEADVCDIEKYRIVTL